MKDIYQVIKGPLITEKSTRNREQINQYAFIVDRRANKAEIKEAIEKLFKVKVAEVHTQNMRGKPRRFRQFRSREPHWKKAWVTLKEGTIEIFQGV
jgi:large subunit ribosomal protein L23